MAICFIVGHGKSASGGYDPGATWNGYQEFQIAKNIAWYAQEYYNATYNEHCDLMNYDGSLYLSNRIKKANAAKYAFVAEFHLNAGHGTGTEVYYSNGDKNGLRAATEIAASIANTFEVKNRGAKTKLMNNGKDYFGIIRQTTMTALLIETLFVDTQSDVSKIAGADGQRKCGVAIAKAVAKARGISEKAKPAATKPATTQPSGSKTSTPTVKKKTNEEVAKDVIAGKYGNNPTRKAKLIAEGYDYAAVQAIVDSMLKAKKTFVPANGKKINIKINAHYVIGGKKSSKMIPPWVIKSTLYCRSSAADKVGSIAFSTQKTGAITGRVLIADVTDA